MVTELMLYGDIGENWWTGDGITETMVLDHLRELDPEAPSHTVRINSLGGDCAAGLTIMNVMRSHKAQMQAFNPEFKLKTFNDGYCCSAATLPFMTGDERTISLGGVFMIHDALSGIMGNADDMRKNADRLDKVSENISTVYATLATPADKDAEQRDAAFFRALMKAETYFVNDEAIKVGLATHQDLSVNAALFAGLSPETMKGKYSDLMYRHAKKRTYMRPTATASLLDLKLAEKRFEAMVASMGSI